MNDTIEMKSCKNCDFGIQEDAGYAIVYYCVCNLWKTCYNRPILNDCIYNDHKYWKSKQKS